MLNFNYKFQKLKELNLPTDQFVIVSSGALAVREIRDAEDVDVIVRQLLWESLSKIYDVEFNEQGIERIKLGEDIEILNPTQSIYGNSGIVSIEEIFEKADTFDGIKFINLEHLKKIKLKLGREKDLRDVELIDNFLK
jgi:hypothetical protein